MHPWLVADVGGTSARFSLVTRRGLDPGAYLFSEQRDYPVSCFNTFFDCLSKYIATLTSPYPKHACIAVAGPVLTDRVQFTNVNWHFSIEQARKQFLFERLEVINDFAAMACSLTHLQAADCWQLVAGKPSESGVKTVIGPGTGLGTAALIKHCGTWLPLPGEGGHITFAPQTSRELDVCKVLQKKLGHVAVENLLSGPGLVNIYQSLARLDNSGNGGLTPIQISGRAVAKNDSLAQEALDIFCGVLGSFCGDVAMIYGATGGVYLAGGILPGIKEYILHSQFAGRFKQKGTVSAWLENIPVQIIIRKNPALIGAAAWLDG